MKITDDMMKELPTALSRHLDGLTGFGGARFEVARIPGQAGFLVTAQLILSVDLTLGDLRDAAAELGLDVPVGVRVGFSQNGLIVWFDGVKGRDLVGLLEWA